MKSDDKGEVDVSEPHSTDPAGSPWADPGADIQWATPPTPVPAPQPRHEQVRPAQQPSPAPRPQSSTDDRSGRLIAIVVMTCIALGLVVIIVLSATGVLRDPTSTSQDPAKPADVRPPLAKLCPAPDKAPSPGPIVPPPQGPRTNDNAAGISYRTLAEPFQPWDRGVWDAGDLGVDFMTGYYFVTEEFPGGDYLASVLSGSVPATVGDSLTLNLECAGQQVAEDVRRGYYPQPNQREDVRNEYTTLGGLPAWISLFHLTFDEVGLQAQGELVAVVTVDVGRSRAAVLYASLPDTHQQMRPDIDAVIDSVRPAR